MTKNEPKIAIMIPYFSSPDNEFPNYFEYWQKSAAANFKIDFFIPTNVDIKKYVKYSNIHFLKMDVENYWDSIQNLLGCEIVRDYYKTGEFRPLCGLLFKEILQDYDYWGSSEFDLIYGNIIKMLKPYLESDMEVIGNLGHLRIIKNTDELRYMPLADARDILHPLNIRNMASTRHCCFWDEIRGMGLRYYQAGIDVAPLKNIYADIDQKYKYFSVLGRSGKWGFTWKDGVLTGYNNRNEEMEFLYVHFQKRKLIVPQGKVADKFCIVPNEILNDSERSDRVNEKSIVYTIKNRWRYHKRFNNELKLLSPELKIALEETSQYCHEHGLLPTTEKLNTFRKIKSLF